VTSPTREEVLQQLSRILDSPPLSGSARLRRLLRYVVERTCAGDGGPLGEFRIATEVFDRDTRFDSRLDSLVRVEARRLRTKLAEYYRERGASDAVIIRIPGSGFTPKFERRSPAVPQRPLPFSKRMTWRVTCALTMLIVIALIAWSALPER
jgi:hypothetical protein